MVYRFDTYNMQLTVHGKSTIMNEAYHDPRRLEKEDIARRNNSGDSRSRCSVVRAWRESR